MAPGWISMATQVLRHLGAIEKLLKEIRDHQRAQNRAPGPAWPAPNKETTDD